MLWSLAGKGSFWRIWPAVCASTRCGWREILPTNHTNVTNGEEAEKLVRFVRFVGSHFKRRRAVPCLMATASRRYDKAVGVD